MTTPHNTIDRVFARLVAAPDGLGASNSEVLAESLYLLAGPRASRRYKSALPSIVAEVCELVYLATLVRHRRAASP